jgi:hypothetical protein
VKTIEIDKARARRPSRRSNTGPARTTIGSIAAASLLGFLVEEIGPLVYCGHRTVAACDLHWPPISVVGWSRVSF